MPVKGGLRDLRLSSGLSLREAEKALGLGHGHLSQYERGIRRLSFTMVGPMSTLYGVPVEEVLAAARRDLDARLAREEAARAEAAR